MSSPACVVTTTHRADSSTDSPPKKVSCQAGDLASGGSGSLGQVGASAKEVSHKAEAEIPGNAASIHAEGRNGGGLLARKTTPLRFKKSASLKMGGATSDASASPPSIFRRCNRPPLLRSGTAAHWTADVGVQAFTGGPQPFPKGNN
jgi:hypothetical protein